MPANAKKLRGMMLAHRGVFIVTPEYNASLPPLLKNTIDWISRAKEPAGNPFKECVFALGSTSDGWRGGYRALAALRQSLELGLETLVVPEMISVPLSPDSPTCTGTTELTPLRTTVTVCRWPIEVTALVGT